MLNLESFETFMHYVYLVLDSRFEQATQDNYFNLQYTLFFLRYVAG